MNWIKKNWHLWLPISLVVMMCVVVAVIFWFLFFEEPYLTYQNIPFPVRAEAVYPGGQIPLIVRRCNSSNEIKNYISTHTIEDLDTNLFVNLPPVLVSIMPGCTTALNMLSIVPKDFPPGRYRVIGVSEVRGKLRTHHIDWYSNSFHVINPPWKK